LRQSRKACPAKKESTVERLNAHLSLTWTQGMCHILALSAGNRSAGLPRLGVVRPAGHGGGDHLPVRDSFIVISWRYTLPVNGYISSYNVNILI